MGEVTITEYETVEKEITRVECDSCGMVVEKDESTQLRLREHREGGGWRTARRWQCDECCETDVPVSLRDFFKLRKVEGLKMGLAAKLVWLFTAQAFVSHPLVTWLLWDVNPWLAAGWFIVGGFFIILSIAAQDAVVKGLFGVSPLEEN